MPKCYNNNPLLTSALYWITIYTGTFLVVFFFGGTVIIFAAVAVAVAAESATAFALADALAVHCNLADELLAASDAPVETLALGGD